MERLLEEMSFEASDLGEKSEPIDIDSAYVDKYLNEISRDEDLSRFIL
jgi:ATP-dependent HslUV protease ATP-binding subunit HslU